MYAGSEVGICKGPIQEVKRGTGEFGKRQGFPLSGIEIFSLREHSPKEGAGTMITIFESGGRW